MCSSLSKSLRTTMKSGRRCSEKSRTALSPNAVPPNIPPEWFGPLPRHLQKGSEFSINRKAWYRQHKLLRWMKEIFHHLGSQMCCNSTGVQYVRWCKISSMRSTTTGHARTSRSLQKQALFAGLIFFDAFGGLPTKFHQILSL